MTEDQRIRVSCHGGYVTWAVYVLVALLFPPHDPLLSLIGQGLIAGMAATGVLGLVLSCPRLQPFSPALPLDPLAVDDDGGNVTCLGPGIRA